MKPAQISLRVTITYALEITGGLEKDSVAPTPFRQLMKKARITTRA
jgi:hypothetical protein